MSMMSDMNNFSQLTEEKTLATAVAAPCGVLQQVLGQIPVCIGLFACASGSSVESRHFTGAAANRGFLRCFRRGQHHHRL